MKAFVKSRYFWLLISCIVFVLLRFPSLIEPNWYGDEGIYQVVGNALNSGRILYQQIWDNKPPLLYIIYAVSSSNLYIVKLLSLLSGLASVVAFYFLANKILKNKLALNISTVTYAVLFGSPILEGNIANAENFMLFPTILSALLILKYKDSRKRKFLIFAGLLLSISLALKIVAVFDAFAFLVFLILTNTASLKKFSKEIVFFGLSFISLLLFFSAYFAVKGAFSDFLQGVFFQNYSYVGEENSVYFPMAILVFKTVFIGIILFLFLKYRKRISENKLFIYIWILFAVYSAFFSARPYTHYLLVVLPPFCLLFSNFFNRSKKNLLEILIIIFIVFSAFFHFQIYKKTFAYYGNFFSFIFSHETITDYESFFDTNTPRDYMLANFITSNIGPNENVFLWSDNAQIYALSNKLPTGKYIVAYHIKFYSNADVITRNQIESVKPRYIIQTADGPIVDNVLSSYQLKYLIDGAKIYERQI